MFTKKKKIVCKIWFNKTAKSSYMLYCIPVDNIEYDWLSLVKFGVEILDDS